jgi:MoxR-like ATPase
MLARTYTIKVSDRRLNECLKVMQGSAVLAGRNIVGLDDFKSLLYVLWEKEEQIPNIEAELAKIVNPYDEQFAKLRDSFNQVKNSIDSASDDTERLKKAVASKNALSRIIGRTNKLCTEASRNGRDISEFEKFRDSIVKYNEDMINKSFNKSFGPATTTPNNDSDEDSNDDEI